MSRTVLIVFQPSQFTKQPLNNYKITEWILNAVLQHTQMRDNDNIQYIIITAWINYYYTKPKI